MTFDPKLTKKNLREWEVDMHREYVLSAQIKNHAAASVGSGVLRTAIRCILVGFYKEARELLLKGRMYVHAAIEENEIPVSYAKGLTESYRCRDHAQYNWLMHNLHDAKSCQQAAQWRDVWFEEFPQFGRQEVQFGLTDFLEAGDYQRVIERFEWAEAKKPTALRNIKGEGSMCYVIARQRLGLEYTSEEIEAATESFLKRSIPKWIGGDGRYTTAARWLKIAHWKKGDDAFATVLGAYDYLHGLKPPKYP
jgi:hypothetical protein